MIVLVVLAVLFGLVARANGAPRASAGDAFGAGRDADPSERRGVDTSAGFAADIGAEDDDNDDDARASDLACNCDPAMLAQIAATAPTLAAIVDAAQRTAGVGSGSDPTSSWRRRSRWSALVPLISFRVGTSQSWREVYDPTIAAAGVPPALSHAMSWDARAAWRLDDLLYDPNEPRFTAFELARRRERRHIAAAASHVYYRWLRAAAAAERDSQRAVRRAEAEAELDALTDGWFSRHRRGVRSADGGP